MPSIEHLSPHHILGRKSHPALMYDVENIYFVCGVCHNAIHNGNPMSMFILKTDIEDNYTENHIYKLRHKSATLPQLKHQNIKKHLQQLIEELENG
jgi:hypothetical protein